MSRGTFRLLLALLALLAALTMAACGDDDDDDEPAGGGGQEASESADMPGEGKPAVTLGTKDFTEEVVLGERYKQALEAKGYTVNLKKNIGATEIIDKALTSDEIDGYPEYLGVAVAGGGPHAPIPQSAPEAPPPAQGIQRGRGQVISEQTPFFDVDAIATTKEFAEQNGLKTVADLKKLDSFTVGARPEF